MTRALSIVCLIISTLTWTGVLGVDLEGTMLRLHNEARKLVREGKLSGQPAAASMPDLAWDAELAAKAQQLANRCRVGHDTNAERTTSRFRQANPSSKRGFKLWLDEHQQYRFESGQCSGVCGHYTQVSYKRFQQLIHHEE